MELHAPFIKQAAIEVGFDACGIAKATPLTEEEWGYDEWLSNGYQAGMAFMEQHRDMRSDPTLLVPGAKSVIVLLVGYKPSQTMQGPARIAQYAYGEDYHERIKRMLFQLITAIRDRYPDFEAKPCVDTVPISDKQWARRAGLGWIGRNTLLVNPTLGSYCNIGELVTPYPTDQYDTPIANRCGDCHACVDACPNHALSESRANLFAMPSQNMVTTEGSNKVLMVTTEGSNHALSESRANLSAMPSQNMVTTEGSNHALSESRANLSAMPSQSIVTTEGSNKVLTHSHISTFPHSQINDLTNSQINELKNSPIPLLNANRCASYHTIENRAETLPPDIHLSDYAFGCDICQLACPYNQSAVVRYQLTDEHKKELEELRDADPTAFKHATKHTALNRIRHSQWIRNQNSCR